MPNLALIDERRWDHPVENLVKLRYLVSVRVFLSFKGDRKHRSKQNIAREHGPRAVDIVKCPWSSFFIYDTLILTILHYITLHIVGLLSHAKFGPDRRCGLLNFYCYCELSATYVSINELAITRPIVTMMVSSCGLEAMAL